MSRCKCKACGAEINWDELVPVTVHEDYGDVCCMKCPSCKRVEYDGMELFEEIDEELL